MCVRVRFIGADLGYRERQKVEMQDKDDSCWHSHVSKPRARGDDEVPTFWFPL